MAGMTNRAANGDGKTNAERQRIFKAKQAARNEENARIADAARKWHAEMLIAAFGDNMNEWEAPFTDCAFCLTGVAETMEWERRKAKKVVKPTKKLPTSQSLPNGSKRVKTAKAATPVAVIRG